MSAIVKSRSKITEVSYRKEDLFTPPQAKWSRKNILSLRKLILILATASAILLFLSINIYLFMDQELDAMSRGYEAVSSDQLLMTRDIFSIFVTIGTYSGILTLILLILLSIVSLNYGGYNTKRFLFFHDQIISKQDVDDILSNLASSGERFKNIALVTPFDGCLVDEDRTLFVWQKPMEGPLFIDITLYDRVMFRPSLARVEIRKAPFKV